MIKRFSVDRLRGTSRDTISLTLNPGLNLLTGKNGSGKTTLMKVMWFLISGNIERATVETPFQSATIETDKYTMTLECRGTQATKIHINGEAGAITLDQEYDEDGDPDPFNNIEEEANQRTVNYGSSIYFPTFRRIEGGYGIQSLSGQGSVRTRRISDTEEALNKVAASLTNESHRFVASVSTTDISRLLLQRYAELSELFNQRQSDVSQSVIEQIKMFEGKPSLGLVSDESASAVLDDVKRTIESLDDDRERVFLPIVAIRKIVEGIFKGKSIKFGPRLSFGDAALAVSSEHLSAGEKQMLSFVCYNALTSDSTIFIDEPELSLHPDWQRELFRVLEEQDTHNQFFIATHSPFIYARYPEAEIRLDYDRGDHEDHD